MQVAKLDQELVRRKLEHEELDQQETDINVDLNGLQKHSDVIKDQNLILYDELDAISRTDDFVREKLKRYDVVESIKLRNY